MQVLSGTNYASTLDGQPVLHGMIPSVQTRATMNRLFLAAAAAATLASISGPAQAADLYASINKYCSSAKPLNNRGISIAPGTTGGVLVQKVAEVSANSYKTLWAVAKSSGVPSCSKLF